LSFEKRTNIYEGFYDVDLEFYPDIDFEALVEENINGSNSSDRHQIKLATWDADLANLLALHSFRLNYHALVQLRPPFVSLDQRASIVKMDITPAKHHTSCEPL